MFYIYAHLNPQTNEIFYIGRGTGRRMYREGGRTPRWVDYVRNSNGFKPIQLISVATREDAITYEKEIIRQLMSEGISLVNERISGNGADASRGFVFTGRKHTESAKEKCRLANLNKPKLEESKQLNRIAHEKPMRINGVVYSSGKTASETLNIPEGSFSYLTKVNKPYQYKNIVINQFEKIL